MRSFCWFSGILSASFFGGALIFGTKFIRSGESSIMMAIGAVVCLCIAVFFAFEARASAKDIKEEERVELEDYEYHRRNDASTEPYPN